MRIAIYQCEPRPAQVDRNLERLARIAEHASTEGVDLLVCPEMYLTGYNIGIDAVRELAETSDGTSARAVAEMTRENSVAIVYGYPERGSEDAIFNSAQPGRPSPAALRRIVDSNSRIRRVRTETSRLGAVDLADTPTCVSEQVINIEDAVYA